MGDEKSIFRVEINEKGAEAIRRIYPLTKVIFWVSLVVHLAPCVYYGVRFSKLLAYRRIFETQGSYRLLLYPVYLLLMVITTFLCYYYFLKFSRRAKESIEHNDGASFNDAFQWIHKALLFILISLVFSGIFTFLTFFLYWV